MTRRQLIAALAALTLAIALPACGDSEESTPEQGAPPITIGTKNFTEQFILGELYKQALEANGFEVELKSDIGSSEIVDRALTAGSLDMYPEYTGVMLSEIAGQRKRPKTADGAYRAAKKFQAKRGFALLEMTPFSDSNALASTPQFARKNGIKTIADLDDVPGGVRIGAPPEFRTRFEGLVGLREVYGLSGVRLKAFKIGAQYGALDKGKVDVAAVFTTDGQLEKGRYAVLRDPEALFAFQNVAPVIKADLVKRFPKIAEVINSVSARLTTEAMREMNADATQGGQKPEAVATRFLREQGLAR
jgi:osmoprotectant transport system substrate-binding protein